MYNACLFLLLLFSFCSYGQGPSASPELRNTESQLYISFPLTGLAEPHLAIGPSAGYRFSERSEVFLETAYVTSTPFYEWNYAQRIRGFRGILQYRYHFLQQWRPLFHTGSGRRMRRSRNEPFVAVEGRIKPFSFSVDREIVNAVTNDTLSAYNLEGRATVSGAALVFGNSLQLSRNERWKLECTLGLGAKQRRVQFKNMQAGYARPAFNKRVAFQVPAEDEPISTAYIPFTLRLRYIIN